MRTLIAVLVIAALAAGIYSNTFAVPFQFDDESNIVKNPWANQLAHFLDLSGTRYIGFFSFALNYHFGGLHVFGYHLVNLCIHIVNGCLVYWLVVLLCRASPPLLCKEGVRNGNSSQRDEANISHSLSGDVRRRSELAGEVDATSYPTCPSLAKGRASWIALAIAALFIAHPIQTQAVTYIVQRFASLVTLFYLLAVVGYLKWRLSARLSWCLVALCSTILAMKTKENSFTIPLMLLLMEGVFFGVLTRRRWMGLLPFLCTLLIIPLSQAGAIGEAEGFARDTMEIGRLDYLFTQFRVIVTYLRLLVLPIRQNLDYVYPIYHSLFQPAVFFSFCFLLALFILAIGLLIRTRRPADQRPATSDQRRRLIGFGILWFFLTLSIESSIVPIKDVIFEHRLYLPGVGFFLAAGLVADWGWERWARGRVLLAICGVVILGLLVGATYRRNLVWRDKMTLWQDVVTKAPANPRGHYNLGLAYEEKGRLDAAAEAYRTTMALKPDFTDAYNNLGNVYKAQGRIDEAIVNYQQAMTIDPKHAEAHNNLGNIYTVQGRLDEAVRLYERALELKPTYAEACNNLGIAYTTLGRLDEAIAVYRKGLSLQADLDKTHYNLGNTYVKKRMMDEAIQEYRTAMQLRPDLPEYDFALGNAYTDAGQPDEAIRAYETTIRLKPDFAEAHFALGNAYAGQKRFKEAMSAYETAVRLKPDFAEVHNNLGNIHALEGRPEEAARAYRQALDLKPDYAEAAGNLRRVTEQLGHTSPLP